MDAKLKNILETLNALHCPYAGDGKDQWLSDVLFKSSFERYNLMEWILEQLGINVLETSQNENSVESKIQNLTEVLSAIGVCGDRETDVIEGTSSRKRQLTFWSFLCCMLSERNYLDNLSLESVNSNDSDSERNASKYARCTEYAGRVCESVNLTHMFDRKLQLFPSHLSKEVKEFFKKSLDQEVQYFPDKLSYDLNQFFRKSGANLTSEEIRKNYFLKFGIPESDPDINSYMDIQQENIEFKEFQNQVIPEKSALNEMEDSIDVSLKNLQNLSSQFEDVHNNLKPFLTDVKPEEFIDIGPAFKATDEKLNSLLKLKNSASTLKFLDSELEILKSDVADFHTSSGCLSDAKLEEYLGILSQTEHKGQNLNYLEQF